MYSDPGQWHLVGTLDFSTVTRLGAEGAALMRHRALAREKRLVVDLSAVQSANSAGLALLLEWMQLARERGIQLSYRHLPDSLTRIAAFSNLQTLLPIAA